MGKSFLGVDKKKYSKLHAIFKPTGSYVHLRFYVPDLIINFYYSFIGAEQIDTRVMTGKHGTLLCLHNNELHWKGASLIGAEPIDIQPIAQRAAELPCCLEGRQASRMPLLRAWLTWDNAAMKRGIMLLLLLLLLLILVVVVLVVVLLLASDQ